MDGFEVCTKLKNNPLTQQIPVIFVTARTDVEAVERGFDVGGDDYVSKPFNDRVLLARLKTHIERYQLQRDMIREHALMTSVLEDSPIMFCRFNGRKQIEYTNQAFQHWFRGDFYNFIGENLLEHFPNRADLDFIRYLERITPDNPSDTQVFSHVEAGGDNRFIQWTYRGIFGEDQQVVAYQCFGKDVTEQQIMIQKLNERNTLLEHSQAVGKMLNWDMDPATGIITFEGELSQIIKNSNEKLDIVELMQYMHPDDRGRLKKELDSYASGKTPVSTFFRVVVGGITYSLRVHGFYEHDKKGKIIAYRGIFQDVSELIGYKEQSEHLKREQISIYEALGEGIVMMDLKSTIIQANDAAARMAGYETAAEIIGKKCYKVFHSSDKECVPCTSREAIREGRRVQIEKPHGNDRIWSVSSTPIFNSEGEIISVIELLSDTTELHQRQRELILNRERLNTAFDAAMIGTFTIHLPAKTWIPDVQLMHLYGIKGGAGTTLSLGHWYELVHPDDLPKLMKAVDGSFRQKTNSTKFEFRLNTPEGTARWFRCTMQVIERDEQNQPKMIIGVSIDITKERSMLDTIKLQEETLAQSRKLKAMGQLTGGIAHDFNNMLATILGFAELLTEELKDDEELSYYCKNITDTCERAATLTDQLLTFSRKQRKQTTAIDIHEMILGSMDLLRHALHKNITVKHFLKAKEHYIMGEFAQLQNILLNMGFNARDAMPDGGVFELRTENIAVYEEDVSLFPVDIEPGNYIALHVSDTGIGMEKEVLSKIFEPFFTTKDAGKGTGLGLSSVYGTINAHNGSIYAESTPGEGTVFHIYFPVSALKPKEVRTENRTRAHRAVSGSTILIIDDEEAIRRMLAKSLEYMGYEVLEAGRGQDGVAIFRENRDKIVAVILDVIMPEMDGVQIYKELIRIDPEVAVLISSGFANNEQTTALKELGVKGYLKKPYRQSDLIKAIENILN
ncbi:MAG: response regulator, partial [Candidatus Marinimicrobia bacterium]|nr:response regulator [Candidatus Neomarinimicrobiota bacterium]